MIDPKKNIENVGVFSYDRLFLTLEKKSKNKQYLIDNGIHRNTLYKIVNGENITTKELAKICYLLECKINDIMEYIPK